MTLSRRQTLMLMAAAPVALSAGSALAGTDTDEVIKVDLWDKGLDAIDAFDDSMPIMLGTPGAKMLDSAPMGVKVDRKTVPAGEVRFEVVNSSKDIEHEMIVVPIADTSKPLPYDAEIQRFDEDAAGALGEVPETEPGESGVLVLRLKPGTYMLACNIPGHYAMGMWTLITVT